MAWYDIPSVDFNYVFDANGKPVDVLLSAKNFEQLCVKMEDLLDFFAVQEVLTDKSQQFYTKKEISDMIEWKKHRFINDKEKTN